jgi:hypothetical protein
MLNRVTAPRRWGPMGDAPAGVRALGDIIVSRLTRPQHLTHTRALGSPTVLLPARCVAPSIIRTRAIGHPALSRGLLTVAPAGAQHARQLGTATARARVTVGVTALDRA